ncbi:hypothetical protein [Sediminibacillus albus]|uniref:hypothetical protein n=1 Tax=Sediminibacillus albus TaxID=407036 RepID=UPI001FDED25C|nr:hypothetical protein [Sediminibacillus albus]
MKHLTNQFSHGDVVHIAKTGEPVTISKWQYIKHMKKYSYIVAEYPGTFYFEEELQKA